MSDLDDHPFSPKSVAYESGEWEEPMTITLDEQIKVVAREIAIRQRIYPKWVDQGKMKLDQCDYQINAMKAVLETLIQARGIAAEEGESTLEYFNRYVAGDR